jgi:hypothetical protein
LSLSEFMTVMTDSLMDPHKTDTIGSIGVRTAEGEGDIRRRRRRRRRRRARDNRKEEAYYSAHIRSVKHESRRFAENEK